MYRYDEFDHTVVAERVLQFRDQVARRLSGDLSEDEFKPLRLMNGLYLPAPRLHAARRHPLWHPVIDVRCACWPIIARQAMIKWLWPFHDAPERSV